MANYQLLKADIDEKVYENAQQKINGANLNAVLNAMVSTLGAEYQFAGVATTATNPGTPDAKVFYIANGKGTYTHFNNIEVTEDEVVVLYWDTEWHKVSTGIASQEKLTELESSLGYNIEGIGGNPFSIINLSRIIPSGSVVMNLGNTTEYVYLYGTKSERISLYGGHEVTLEFDVDALQMPNTQNFAYNLRVKGVLDTKQNTLVFDDVPTKDSKNVLTSGAVFDTVDGLGALLNGKEHNYELDVVYGTSLNQEVEIKIKRNEKFKISLGFTNAIGNKDITFYINGDTSKIFGAVEVGSHSEFVAPIDITSLKLYLDKSNIKEDGSLEVTINILGLSQELNDKIDFINLQSNFVVNETKTEVVMRGDEVELIKHYIGKDIIRTDAFTYKGSLIQELRTLSNGKTATIIIDTNTFEKTINYN